MHASGLVWRTGDRFDAVLRVGPKAIQRIPNADAMRNLGVMYLNGRGVEQDEHKAAQWYRTAAEASHADAMETSTR